MRCQVCGNEGVFTIEDAATVEQARRRTRARWLPISVVLVATVVACVVIGFGQGVIWLQVVSIPVGLILLPIAFAMPFATGGMVGVKMPPIKGSRALPSAAS